MAAFPARRLCELFGLREQPATPAALWNAFVERAGRSGGRAALSAFFEAALRDTAFRDEVVPLLGEDTVRRARAVISAMTARQLRLFADHQSLLLAPVHGIIALDAAFHRFRPAPVLPEVASLVLYPEALTSARVLLLAGRDSISVLHASADVIVANATLLPTMGALTSIVQAGVQMDQGLTSLCAALADHPPPALASITAITPLVTSDPPHALADPPRLPVSLRDADLRLDSEPLLHWFTRAWQSGPPLRLETLRLKVHTGLARLLTDVHFPRLASLTIVDAALPPAFFPLLGRAAPRLESLALHQCTVPRGAADVDLPPSLRTLTLQGLSQASYDTLGSVPLCDILAGLASAASPLRLETLNIGFGWQAVYLQNADAVCALHALLARAPPLRSLYLYGAHMLYPAAALALVRALGHVAPTLTSLTLLDIAPDYVRDTSEPTNPHAYARRLGEALVVHCPGLLSLTVAGKRPVTDELYAALTDGLGAHPALRSLHLERCSRPDDFFPLTAAAFARINARRMQEARWGPSWGVVVPGILSAQERRVAAGERTGVRECGLMGMLPAHVLRQIGAFLPGPFVQLAWPGGAPVKPAAASS
jgi:hypothetical protein